MADFILHVMVSIHGLPYTFEHQLQLLLQGLMFNLNVLEHQWVVTAVYFGDVYLLGCGCYPDSTHYIEMYCVYLGGQAGVDFASGDLLIDDLFYCVLFV